MLYNKFQIAQNMLYICLNIRMFFSLVKTIKIITQKLVRQRTLAFSMNKSVKYL